MRHWLGRRERRSCRGGAARHRRLRATTTAAASAMAMTAIYCLMKAGERACAAGSRAAQRRSNASSGGEREARELCRGLLPCAGASASAADLTGCQAALAALEHGWARSGRMWRVI